MSWIRYFFRPQTITFSEAQPAADFVCSWKFYFLQMWNNLAIKCTCDKWGYKVCAFIPPSSHFYHDKLILTETVWAGDSSWLFVSALICVHQSWRNVTGWRTHHFCDSHSLKKYIEDMAYEPVCMPEYVCIPTTSVLNLLFHKFRYTVKVSTIY